MTSVEVKSYNFYAIEVTWGSTYLNYALTRVAIKLIKKTVTQNPKQIP